jgi:hypothetical protein
MEVGKSMNDKEINELVELFKEPVNDIYDEGPYTIIEFKNGKKIPILKGENEFKLDIHVCGFCGITSEHKTLFTTDDKNYICPDCVTLALTTFLKNGVNIEFGIDDIFPEAAEKLKNMIEK